MMFSRVDAYLAAATEAARRAGALLARRRGPPAYRTKRNAVDLVTASDRAAERLIRRMLRRRFPGHGFWGEEHGRVNPGAAWQWVVDPLDGTTNFVHRVPVFCVSIALVERGRPVLGVVYDPNLRELFTAAAGRGAWLNGRRLRVSHTARLAQALLGTGFSARFRQDPAPYLRWFAAFQARCHAVRRMGSTALSLAYVACGRQDGFYERDLWPWDVAAGLVLIHEAGGCVTDFSGMPVRLPRTSRRVALVASNGRIHRQMLAHLTSDQ